MANAVESIIENVHEFLHLFHFLDNFLSAESRFEKEEVISLKIILHVFNLPSIPLVKNKIVGPYLVTFITLDTVTLEAQAHKCTNRASLSLTGFHSFACAGESYPITFNANELLRS